MTTSDDLSWRLLGGCYSLHPDLFYSEIPDDIQKAKAICFTCQVFDKCKAFADANKEEYGVWAGELRSESKTAINHGTYTGYVRGCRRTDCAENDGCAGAKRRYSAGVKERAKAKGQRLRV